MKLNNDGSYTDPDGTRWERAACIRCDATDSDPGISLWADPTSSHVVCNRCLEEDEE